MKSQVLPSMAVSLFFHSLSTEAAIHPASGTASVLSGNEWLQWGSGLGVVIFLILVSAWILRRLNRLSISRGKRLIILGGISVGTRERVILLQAGEKQLLLGVAPGRVATLHVFEPGEIGAAEDDIPAGTGDAGFAGRFKQAMRGQ